MQTVLIVIHLMIVVALTAVVLLQRSEGGALGMGGGSGFMTGRGQANVLTRATAILAALFFATSLGLTLLANYGRGNKSILEGVAPGTSQPAATIPPKGQGSVLDQLRKLEDQRANKPANDSQGSTPVPAPQSSATPASATPASATPASATPASPRPATDAPLAAAPKVPVEPTGMPTKPAADAPSASPAPSSAPRSSAAPSSDAAPNAGK